MMDAYAKVHIPKSLLILELLFRACPFLTTTFQFGIQVCLTCTRVSMKFFLCIKEAHKQQSIEEVRRYPAIMRRLVPFLIAAIMASFPPSLLLVFIGGLVSTATYGPTSSVCHQNSNYCRDDNNIIIGGYSSSIGTSTGNDIRTGGGSSSKSGGFVTGVAAASHTVYVSPSHYPMVATTATIVASTIGGSGGKKKRVGGIQSVDAETMVPIIIHDEVDDSIGSSSSCGGGSNSNCGEEDVSEGDGTIKVSVLGMSKGKSPSCGHSLVEFTNTVSFYIDVFLFWECVLCGLGISNLFLRCLDN